MYLEEKKLGPLVETKPESPELKAMRRARALIAKGWTQGAAHRTSWSWGRLRDSYCSLGAIRMATMGNPYITSLSALDLVGALAEAAGTDREGIVGWNDCYPTQTKANVLAAFDRAIASLE